MQFTIRPVFFVLLAVFSATMALPILESRDVFSPPILLPKAGDVFKAGDSLTVTWDTSKLPTGLQNLGELVLGQLTIASENLDIEHPLKKGFLLTDGQADITLPTNLTTASNYIIDLFGDSGNISSEFTIYAA